MDQLSIYKMPNTNICLLAPLEDLDFFDSQSMILPRAITSLQAWNIVMLHTMPLLNFAFQVRDKISSWFGVQQIGGFSGKVPVNPQVGEQLNFFRIEYISNDNLPLTSGISTWM